MIPREFKPDLIAVALATCAVAVLWWLQPGEPPKGAEHYRTCQISKPGTHPVFDPPRSAIVPCRDLDAWLGTQWDI